MNTERITAIESAIRQTLVIENRVSIPLAVQKIVEIVQPLQDALEMMDAKITGPFDDPVITEEELRQIKAALRKPYEG